MDPKDSAALGSSRPNPNLVSITVIPVSTDTLRGGPGSRGCCSLAAGEDKEQGQAGDSLPGRGRDAEFEGCLGFDTEGVKPETGALKSKSLTG